MTHLDSDLTLLDPDGHQVAVTDLITDRYLVVQLVRYFGCLPCQDWLIQLDRLTPDLHAAHASAVAIGGSADYQARWLRDQRGVRMPLLMDPDHEVRKLLDLTAPLGWRMADPRGIASYTRSLARGTRPQKITRDTVRSPAVVILDASGTVLWRHHGQRIGDYPHHRTILQQLDRSA